jgi:hypothetical protein
LVSSSRRIALASLFGVLILLAMGFVPAPTSDYLIVFQAFFLALSYLVVGRGGATYVGLVSGLLITLVKISFFPYDLIFSLMFGAMVDVLGTALRVKMGSKAMPWRLVACMTVSTGVIGFVAYYVTAVSILKLVPNDLFLDSTVLIFGVVSGAIGGAVAARLWNRNLVARFHGN